MIILDGRTLAQDVKCPDHLGIGTHYAMWVYDIHYNTTGVSEATVVSVISYAKLELMK